MVMIPTVHLNGTSGEVLLKQNVDACRALNKAIDALCAASPNARDFYPQGEGVFSKADAEFRGRNLRLQAIRNEVNEIVEALSDELAARKR